VHRASFHNHRFVSASFLHMPTITRKATQFGSPSMTSEGTEIEVRCLLYAKSQRPGCKGAGVVEMRNSTRLT